VQMKIHPPPIALGFPKARSYSFFIYHSKVHSLLS
jgi:hypothetical protein